MKTTRCHGNLFAVLTLLILILTHGTLAHNKTSKRCDYGTLPGHWMTAPGRPKGDPHHTWQVFDRGCQLRDMVSFHVAAAKGQLPAGTQLPRRLGILMLGDSNDREVVSDFCRLCETETIPFDITLDDEGDRAESTCNMRMFGQGLNCLTCVTPTLQITREAVWGLLPGKKHESRIGEARERLEKGLELFRREQGREPDMVVLSSNSWDVAQLRQTQAGRDLLALEDLPPSWIDTWITTAEASFKYLAELTKGSGALLVYHTTAFPELINCHNSSQHRAHMLGRRAHIAQLNAAGRHVARKAGFHVVDLESMLAKFVVAAQYLRDDHHPKPFVLLNLLNIYLNMLQHP